MYLAGRLSHRSALSEDERQAASFIKQRLLEYSPDVEIDHFKTIENYPFLFALYYSEFLVVAVLATWFPVVAFFYGLCTFSLYMAEFMGYRGYSRFMTQFDSQNVVARFLAPRPRKLFILTAHYDSGCSSPLLSQKMLPWLRPLHFLVLASMMIILITCGTDALGLLNNTYTPITAFLRWGAVIVLLGLIVPLYYTSGLTEDIRGANSNASGVAALLRLAEKFAAAPLDNADVWLLATGSHESWMSGMRHFLGTHDLDRSETYIVNLEGLGAGRLHYLSGEGMLHLTRSDGELIRASEEVATDFDAAPARLRAVPTGAHIPLSRGYRAMSIMGLDENGLPPHWNTITDRITEVDESSIGRGADFAEAILRILEKDIPSEIQDESLS
jgi:hypothetical protein